MLDLKVIKLKDLAEITGVEFLNFEQTVALFPFRMADDQLPMVLRVTGKNFNKAVNVLVNGVDVVFSIISASTIHATIPRNIISIDNIYVLNDRATFSNASLMSFEVGDKFEFNMGLSKVIAQFVKVLLTTPGSDIFEPRVGGGLQSVPGTKQPNSYSIVSQVAVIILKTAEYIKNAQFNKKIPAAEKLQSVDILAIDTAKGDPSSIDVKLKISTYAQSGVPIELMLGVQDLLTELQG